MALPLAYTPGSLFPPKDIFETDMQRVTGVYLSEDRLTVEIATEEEWYSFSPGEQVVFPRRRDGSTRVWEEGEPVDLSKVAIGDIIPPRDGFRDENFAGALRISNIINSPQYGGFFVDLSPVRKDPDKPIRLFVRWIDHKDFLSYASIVKKNDQRKPATSADPDTVSGWYVLADDPSANPVRFRTRVARGRPPRGCERTPVTAAQWAQYSLMSGEKPHPGDPRYSTAE